MNIYKAFKVELDLTNKQETLCVKHANAARFAYNWGLSKKIEAYQANLKTPTAIDLHKQMNLLKKTELNWMYEVSSCAPHEALRNLDQAFANFFRRVKEKKAGKKVKVGFPKFKSKKYGAGSFRLTGSIRVFEKSVQLPRLGHLRLKERGYIPTYGVKILSATVSEYCGRWYVSVNVEMDWVQLDSVEKPAVGVDLGVMRLATVSDGTTWENPRALKNNIKKIKRLNRVVSRRIKGSANRLKAITNLSKQHKRVVQVRKNTLHQVTSFLAKNKSVVVLEDLNIIGMLSNRRLAFSINDAGLYEFRRQMVYKGSWYGCEVLIANPYFPSTKLCSNCGVTKPEIGPNERIYYCEHCGFVIDRDLNAAINLLNLKLNNNM